MSICKICNNEDATLMWKIDRVCARCFARLLRNEASNKRDLETRKFCAICGRVAYSKFKGLWLCKECLNQKSSKGGKEHG